jgi:4'-phosphopantetheinyl transferase
MPLIKVIEIGNAASIGVWEIDESINELVGQLNLDEQEFEELYSFKSDYRKKQWLSYRLLIKTMVKVDTNYKICYSTSGKPFLINPPRIISVSHSKSFSVVLISDNLYTRYGIDIELIDDKVARVKNKFINKNELTLFSKEPSLELLTALWTAKEAIYKCFDLPGVSLKNNILITHLWKEHNKYKIKAKLSIENSENIYLINSLRIDNYMLSHAEDITFKEIQK